MQVEGLRPQLRHGRLAPRSHTPVPSDAKSRNRRQCDSGEGRRVKKVTPRNVVHGIGPAEFVDEHILARPEPAAS